MPHNLRPCVTAQLPDHGLRVHNIYALSRHVDSDAFDYSVAPQRRLFHGTSLKNLRGILLRGLLMPEVHLFYPLHPPPLALRPLTLHPLVQVVTSRLRVDRSDGGLLGSGLYFSPDAAMSARYAHAGRSTAAAGRRIMFVARVASGREYPCFDTAPHLTEPPAGFDSVVGVASSAEEPTVFGSEEVREDGAVGSSIDRVTCHSQLWFWFWFFCFWQVVVYRQEQQRLEYLIEFNLAADAACPPIQRLASKLAGATAAKAATRLAHQGIGGKNKRWVCRRLLRCGCVCALTPLLCR